MSLTKATLIPEVGGPISAMFNPKELSFSKSTKWEAQISNGMDAPRQQWNNGDAASLSFELFFDRYEDNASVQGDVQRLVSLTISKGELHRPPFVRFVWGGISFLGVVEKVDVRFTMFLPNGSPCRATANVAMKETILDQDSGRSDPLQSPDHAKMRRLKRGETLHSLAAAEYDDPNEWRRIANANGIDNPLDLTPGAELLIPPIIVR